MKKEGKLLRLEETDLLEAVGEVDGSMIEEALTYRPRKKKKGPILLAAAVVCFTLAASLAILLPAFRPAEKPENGESGKTPVFKDGFTIENGVLVSYSGDKTDVTIPEEVETIAGFAFLRNENAANIKTVRLGERVTRIETEAFAGLENLVEIIIAEENLSFVRRDGLLLTSDGSILLRYERENETSFALPEGVRFVAAHAAQEAGLEEIDFGDGLEYVGYNAFASNYDLRAIDLPDSVRYIGEGAFSGCSAAVDGRLPEGVEIGKDAFDRVPFYLSLLAGSMCPGEEIARGLVTPSVAVPKSDTRSLIDQIDYLLAVMRVEGAGLTPSEAAERYGEGARYAFSVGSSLPPVPEDMEIPAPREDLSLLNTVSFFDKGWGGTGVYDLQLTLSAGGYTIVMEAYGYDLFSKLYWKDAVFRIANVYFVRDTAPLDPGGDVVVSNGWTAVFEKDPAHDGQYYKDITFTHENGTIVHYESPYSSTTPYRLTWSPDATRVIAEYTHVNGTPRFVIISLNGDRFAGGKYVDYMSSYFGQYEPGSLDWTDNDNVTGINEYGAFRLNVFDGIPVGTGG